MAKRSDKHVLELDGLRGIAILLVLATHLIQVHDVPHPTLASRALGLVAGLGWCGVDLFFALSGFLITGILLDTRGRHGYFTAFYARRMLRIFPLYYTFLLIVMFALPVLIPGVYPNHTPGQWMYWTYTSSYVGLAYASTLPLSVTWSLAIEEQFYLVWPTVVSVLPRRALGATCGVLMAAALLARGLGVARHWGEGATYFYTLSRMDGLAAGGLAAVVCRRVDLVSLRRWAGRTAAFGVLPVGLLVAIAQRRHLDVRSDPIGKIYVYTFTSILAAAVVLWTVSARPAFLRSEPVIFFARHRAWLAL